MDGILEIVTAEKRMQSRNGASSRKKRRAFGMTDPTSASPAAPIPEIVTAAWPVETKEALPSRKQRAILGTAPNVPVPAASIELVTTNPHQETKLDTSSRRRAIGAVKPTLPAPAALISEPVTAMETLGTISGLPSRQRRAKAVMSSIQDPPAATLPGREAGADEAISDLPTSSGMSRRQSTRANGGAKAIGDAISKGDLPSPKLSRARKRGADQATRLSATTNTTPDPQSSDRTSCRPSPIRLMSESRSDHSGRDAQKPGVAAAPHLASNGEGDDGAHISCESQEAASPVIANRSDHRLDDTQSAVVAAAPIPEIIQLWRIRARWWKAELKLILQAQAVCRAWTDGDKVKAAALFAKVRDDGEGDATLLAALAPFIAAMKPFEAEGTAYEKRVAKLAAQLPVWISWARDVWGLSALGLGKIVGECGDVGSYRNPSCVWKRMGLAVIGDKRQRRVSDVDEALLHGYSPQRRSVVWNIGNGLIGGMGKGVRPLVGENWLAREDWSPYQKLYVLRLVYEAAQDPVAHAREPTAAGKMSFSKHAHNRAKRYVEKRMLRDLWVAWRAADRDQWVAEHQMLHVSVGGTNSRDAGRGHASDAPLNPRASVGTLGLRP